MDSRDGEVKSYNFFFQIYPFFCDTVLNVSPSSDGVGAPDFAGFRVGSGARASDTF